MVYLELAGADLVDRVSRQPAHDHGRIALLGIRLGRGRRGRARLVVDGSHSRVRRKKRLSSGRLLFLWTVFCATV